MSLIFLEAECLGAMEENALVALVLCLLVGRSLIEFVIRTNLSVEALPSATFWYQDQAGWWQPLDRPGQGNFFWNMWDHILTLDFVWWYWSDYLVDKEWSWHSFLGFHNCYQHEDVLKQVSNQDKSIVEGCKSLHIHQRCRAPTNESSTVLGQREEMTRGGVTGARQGKGTKSNVEGRVGGHLAGDFGMFPNTVQYGDDTDTTKKGRKKSRKYTKIGHSTFYNTWRYVCPEVKWYLMRYLSPK